MDWLQQPVATPTGAAGDDGCVDVLLMQEIKCESSAFPSEKFRTLGYDLLVAGQKTYNGVAIASRRPMQQRLTALPTDAGDSQARYLEAEISGIIIGCLYAPNGNPLYSNGDFSDKFAYKLAWLDRLASHAQTLNQLGLPIVLAGDFNIIPGADDCLDITAWHDDALAHPQSLRRWRKLLYQGFTDGWRALHPSEVAFSFWDYQRGAWQKDNGLRIDHFLCNPEAGDMLAAADIDKAPRGKPRASDHTPVLITLDLTPKEKGVMLA